MHFEMLLKLKCGCVSKRGPAQLKAPEVKTTAENEISWPSLVEQTF